MYNELEGVHGVIFTPIQDNFFTFHIALIPFGKYMIPWLLPLAVVKEYGRSGYFNLLCQTIGDKEKSLL